MNLEEPNRLPLREECFRSAFGKGQETWDLGWPNAKGSLKRFSGHNLQTAARGIGHDDAEILAHELKQSSILCQDPLRRR